MAEMNDLFMYMTDAKGNDLSCESAVAINTQDPFMKDEFTAADLESFSNYFDLTDFSFAMEMTDSSSASSGGTSPGGKTSSSSSPSGSTPAASGGEFSEWYKNPELYSRPQDPSQQTFRVNKIAGNFSKVVDSVSPGFFVACCKNTTFDQAIIVKRAFTGSSGGGGGGLGISASVSVGMGGLSASASIGFADADFGSQALGFLRVEMTNVRLTSVSWDDGDLLQEKIGFNCETMTIRYRKQDDSGELESEQQLMQWQATTGQQKNQSGTGF